MPSSAGLSHSDHSHGEQQSRVELSSEQLKALEVIDGQLADVDTETMARQYLQTRDVLLARQAVIADIPDFWPVVFANAATELESAVTRADAQLFSDCLVGLDVTRPEIPVAARPSDTGLKAFGEPHSLHFVFRFKPNDYFSDATLEKTFWLRRAKVGGDDGMPELVSEPVAIDWKSPDKDLTNGLGAAAGRLWAAQQAAGTLNGIVSTADERAARDAAAKAMPEYKELAAMLERRSEGAVSFYNFFAYRGRWVGEAENAEATAAWRAKRERERELVRAGKLKELADDEGADNDDDDDYHAAEADVETFPGGHFAAVTIAEDIWPSAIDYYLLSDAEDDGLGSLDGDESETEEVEL